MYKTKPASIDALEVEKFSRIADEWWDPYGKFKPLHRLNPVRVEYIRGKIYCNPECSKGSTLPKQETDSSPLAEDDKTCRVLKVLDIGCGGGLLCEPMKRLGADVTGIDASEKNIKVASLHAQKSGLDINYICTSAEELADSGVQFDVVLNMEVIEHVADVESFMEAACRLVKPGGMMIIATINRTIKSFMLAIVGAEYILNWLPRGTHNWHKFLKPSEINTNLIKNDMRIEEIRGVTLNPLINEWRISDDIAVNYIMHVVKNIE